MKDLVSSHAAIAAVCLLLTLPVGCQSKGQGGLPNRSGSSSLNANAHVMRMNPPPRQTALPVVYANTATWQGPPANVAYPQNDYPYSSPLPTPVSYGRSAAACSYG